MRVTFVSHASVIVEADDVVLWTDPWLFGRAFNESWALYPEPSLERMEAWLPHITHVFVSHEHPDHFHLPTLRWLPDDFKKRVPILFQRLHSGKMPAAFRRLGFSDVRTFRHREIAELSSRVKFYMFQDAPLDSGCGLIDADGRVMMNLNDCESSPSDREWIRKDLGGSVDILLNQFSIATYDGREPASELVPRFAASMLDRMIEDHRGVGAKLTIPIASFMYFCCSDNAFLNPYRNSIQDTQNAFDRAGQKLVVLCPFGSYEAGQAHDNAAALEYYRELDRRELPLTVLTSVAPEALESAARTFFEDLSSHYPAPLVRRIGAFRFWIPDIGAGYLLDFAARTMTPIAGAEDTWDVKVNSQPLLFALTQPYGFQTLSVSGRFMLRVAERRFMLLRVIAALHNSEIYLTVRDLLSPSFVGFVVRNFRTLVTQFFSKLRLLRRFVD